MSTVGMRARGRAAHKTKQEMTKHLALLASLGMLGMSEHMVQVDLGWHRSRRGVNRVVTEWAAQTNKARSHRTWRAFDEEKHDADYTCRVSLVRCRLLQAGCYRQHPWGVNLAKVSFRPVSK